MARIRRHDYGFTLIENPLCPDCEHEMFGSVKRGWECNWCGYQVFPDPEEFFDKEDYEE